MGQSLSFDEDSENDMQQIECTTLDHDQYESAIKIYSSIYQQTSSIELDCSEDLFGSDNIWSGLPLDGIKYIFEWLSFSDLFNTSRVCKKFNSLCWKHLKEIDISKESKRLVVFGEFQVGSLMVYMESILESAAIYVNDKVLARVLSLIPNIKRLSLYCCRLLTSASLELITLQSNLQSLDLSYVPRLQLDSLGKIAIQCIHLKRLVLSGAYRWHSLGDQSFPFFPSLEVFVFKRPESINKEFREFLQKQCKTLIGLNIDHPQTSSLMDSKIIEDILSNENCREQLEFLNLNCDETMMETHLENLKYFKKLKGLSLSTLGTEETCKKVLNSIGSRLEYLSVCRTGPSTEITNALLTAPLRNLRVLSLHKSEYNVPQEQVNNVKKILQSALNKDGDLGRLECFEFCYVKENSEIQELLSNFNAYFKNIREWKRRLGFDDY